MNDFIFYTVFLVLGFGFGWCLFRSMGWIAIVFLCVLGLSSQAQIGTVCNNGNLPMAFRLNMGGYYNYYGCSAGGCNDIINLTGSGQVIPVEYSCDGSQTWGTMGAFIRNGTPQTLTAGCSSGGGGGGGTNGGSWSATLCVTNLSGFPRWYMMKVSGGQEIMSPAIPSGSYWCWTYQGANSADLCAYDVVWNSDAPQAGMLLGCQSASQGSGSGGGVSDPGEPVWPGPSPQPTNNPAPTNTGGGSKDPLTGDQFANGVSNVVKAIRTGVTSLEQAGGAQSASQVNELKTIDNHLNNVGIASLPGGGGVTISNYGGTNIDYRPYLSVLANLASGDHQSVSNFVDSTNTGGFVGQITLATQLVYNTFAALSNQAGALGSVHTQCDVTYGGNVFWLPRVVTNGDIVSIERAPLTEQNNPWFFHVCTWMRLAETWLIMMYAVWWIHEKNGEYMMRLGQTPSTAVMQGSWTAILIRSVAKSLLLPILLEFMTQIPVIVGAGWSAVLSGDASNAGTWMADAFLGTLDSEVGTGSSGGHTVTDILRGGFWMAGLAFLIPYALFIAFYMLTYGLQVRFAYMVLYNLWRFGIIGLVFFFSVSSAFGGVTVNWSCPDGNDYLGDTIVLHAVSGDAGLPLDPGIESSGGKTMQWGSMVFPQLSGYTVIDNGWDGVAFLGAEPSSWPVTNGVLSLYFSPAQSILYITWAGAPAEWCPGWPAAWAAFSLGTAVCVSWFGLLLLARSIARRAMGTWRAEV